MPEHVKLALKWLEANGWLVVPRDPTSAMMDAAYALCLVPPEAYPYEAYHVMVAAAPKLETD